MKALKRFFHNIQNKHGIQVGAARCSNRRVIRAAAGATRLIEPLELRLLMADTGNTLGTAKDLGSIGTAATITASETVGSADTEDDFKFEVSSIRDVTVSVHWTVGFGRLQLVRDTNNSGLIDSGEVFSDTGFTGGTPAVHQRLPAGTYYAHINNGDSSDAYTLSIKAPAAPADPGNTPGAAKDLGTVPTSATTTISDWVGNADGEDDLKFKVDSIRDVTLTANWTTGFGRLQLVRDTNGNGLVDSGEVLNDTGFTGGSPAIHQRLPAGIYIAHINNGDSDDFYSLAIKAPAAPVDPGNTPGAAKDLGKVSSSASTATSDWIGNADSEDDFKFTIDSIRDVTMSVNWTKGYGRLQFVRDANSNGLVDSGEVLHDTGYTGGTPSLHQRLQPGTYIAHINNGDADDFYTLTIKAPAAQADPGNSPGAAKDLGALNGVVNTSDWVGSADTEDDYKFTIASARLVTFTVNWTTGYGRLQLVKDSNGNGLVDSGEVLNDTGYAGASPSFQAQLAAGTYYARINNGDADDFYALNLSSPVIQTTNVGVTATDAKAAFANADPGVFTITRTGSTAAALTVNYKLTGTAVNGTDYNTLAGSVVIPAGKSSATVTVTPKNGGMTKPDKTVILTLSTSGSYAITSGKSTATVTIQNNQKPNVGITALDASASETPTGPTSTGDFVLTRSGSTSAALTVKLSLASSTATYNTDYKIATYGATYTYDSATKVLTVKFNAGVSAVSIIITPVNDTVAEGNETVAATLVTDVAYAQLPGKASATVTIANF